MALPPDKGLEPTIDMIWATYPQMDSDGNPLPRNDATEAQAFIDWAEDVEAA